MRDAANYLKSNAVVFLCLLLSIFNILHTDKSISRVVFIDVGQGDASLIQFGSFDILVDGGSDSQLENKLKNYMGFNNHIIELLIVTHPHLDHIGGLFGLVEKYQIPTIWVNEVCYESEYYKEFLKRNREILVQVDNTYFVREINTFSLEVLYPIEVGSIDEKCPEGYGKYRSLNRNVNNDSIVLKLTVREKSVLFMGDGEIELERKLLGMNDIRNADLLKAGHHCSNSSSSQQFLDIVNPQIAICSCGRDNKYNHPSGHVLERFNKEKIQYYITYETSDVVIQL